MQIEKKERENAVISVKMRTFPGVDWIPNNGVSNDNDYCTLKKHLQYIITFTASTFSTFLVTAHFLSKSLWIL